jgi:hypothetical protein
MKIVVARYNEDISWTKQFTNVLIYNKGKDLDNTEYNVIKLNNVGREGHTFYKHIYDNYDNLDEHTIFLQGDPFAHTINLIDKLNKYINNKNLKYERIGYTELRCWLSGCKIHIGLPIKEVYKKLFGSEKEEMEFFFTGGGQFIVSKEIILSRPKNFYLKIVKLLEYDVDPIEGYIIERINELIFHEPINNLI